MLHLLSLNIYLKLVTQTPDGLYLPVGMLDLIKLRAKPLDMRVDSTAVTEVVLAPEAIEKVISGKYLARIAGKDPHGLHFLLGHGEFLGSDINSVSFDIYSEIPDV